jgi:hypothetical protein
VNELAKSLGKSSNSNSKVRRVEVLEDFEEERA